jgi:hypothetical protein
MDFRMEHIFDWPASRIVPILSAGEDIVPMEDLPNVSQRKVLERKRSGSKMYSKLEWNVHGQIPKIAQKIISPEKLNFIEESMWDDDTQTFSVRITPHFFKKQIICKTTSSWSDHDGGAKSKRVFGGSLEIRIPVIGPIMERTIIDYLKKNNDENAVMVRKALAMRFGPPA